MTITTFTEARKIAKLRSRWSLWLAISAKWLSVFSVGLAWIIAAAAIMSDESWLSVLVAMADTVIAVPLFIIASTFARVSKHAQHR